MVPGPRLRTEVEKVVKGAVNNDKFAIGTVSICRTRQELYKSTYETSIFVESIEKGFMIYVSNVKSEYSIITRLKNCLRRKFEDMNKLVKINTYSSSNFGGAFIKIEITFC